MKFRKKPVEVNATQWFKHGDHPAVTKYIPHGSVLIDMSMFGQIETLEGMMDVHPGDWIIEGVVGEFYPCRSDIFEMTYERVE